MRTFLILGILLLLSGGGMIGFSYYIKGRVQEGREQIASGEQKVEKGKKLFSLNPITKKIGEVTLFDPAEEKIEKGKSEVERYETLAKRLLIGGILLAIVGFGTLVMASIALARKRR